ncbi:MAG TPA: ATP-grasp domain-containing protein [Acidimicrobiales bacterium]|nr:ATP-grasp domain-containing protein [Acidimicrobiales bacterium]HZB60723.1 ATP-grasp domain-containing protein [Actinomycetota bacterium]
MPRILLLLPTATYRAADFVTAAARLGVDVVVGSEHRQALAGPMGDRAVVVPLAGGDAALDAIAALHDRTPLDAVLAVDDHGVVVAAAAAQRLGLRHNPPNAVAATRDKAAMRERLAAASLPQPAYRIVAHGADIASAATQVGYPCVVKPVSRSASQGVIRVDDAIQAAAAGIRIRAIVGDGPEPLLVERFVPGAEVAVEGLLLGGRLEVLAVFDKPDPMDGPFFEETIYVTPSRQPASVLADLEATVARAAAALGLREGPVHAELRIGTAGALMILELAARSIGGLCARALRFGAGVSLEEVIIRHALGLGLDGLARETQASGVMMLPIRSAGVLDRVSGQERALAIDGVVGVEISIASGRPVVPLPEGDRYLGFVFARGPTAQDLEDALRRAEACLEVRLR